VTAHPFDDAALRVAAVLMIASLNGHAGSWWQ